MKKKLEKYSKLRTALIYDITATDDSKLMSKFLEQQELMDSILKSLVHHGMDSIMSDVRANPHMMFHVYQEVQYQLNYSIDPIKAMDKWLDNEANFKKTLKNQADNLVNEIRSNRATA